MHLKWKVYTERRNKRRCKRPKTKGICSREHSGVILTLGVDAPKMKGIYSVSHEGDVNDPKK